LLDEVDNYNLFNDPKMRQIFNSGHECNGVIQRFIGGQPRRYVIGAPLALATIGALPRPLMSRSIAINMHRSPVPLKPLDEADRAFIIAREAIQKWAARCTLSREPEMPMDFHGRTVDNWRPLLSIADDLGLEFGYNIVARAAAVVLGSDRQYKNPSVTLLTDIRTVFDASGADRLCTKRELIPGLAGLEDTLWAEWTGVDDTAAPHMLTQGDLGRLLRPSRIRSKTIWPPHRSSGGKSESGYYRSQFEKAWADYGQKVATPPHTSRVRHLRKV
jgi:Protein of unknown function (DUF3631)